MEQQQSSVKEIVQARTIERMSAQVADLSVKLGEAEAKRDLYFEMLQQREQQIEQLQQQMQDMQQNNKGGDAVEVVEAEIVDGK